VTPLPASSLRQNIATWAVPAWHLPAVAHVLHDALPNEPWDPHFLGQRLETTYFDTPAFALRKARQKNNRYLTLRIRCYRSPDGGELYALSAKTESEKWRVELAPQKAEMLLGAPALLVEELPGHLLARWQEMAGEDELVAVVTICCRRYAVEDSEDRFTLDVAVATDTGRCLPFGVLEYKSTDGEARPSVPLLSIGLRPIKLSKFLWATANG
jgi:hypothetical protein